MKRIFKRHIKNWLNNYGYEIIKKKDDTDTEDKKNKDLDIYNRIYNTDSVNNKRFYNIGAGSFNHPLWTNVDKDSDWYGKLNGSSINYDLLTNDSIPIQTETAEIVYTSHTIEHIFDDNAKHLFAEVFRILKPRAYFRITCPDVDLDYRAYKENDRDYFYWIDYYSNPEVCKQMDMKIPLNEASTSQIFLDHFAQHTSVIFNYGAEIRINDEEFHRVFKELDYESALNYCTSKCSRELQKNTVGSHINWWNKKKVIRYLKNAGFTEIYESAYGQSRSPVLRNVNLFDNSNPKISLYIEAKK
ncbi:MAG: hypothetical protein HY958_11690 [Bacteroidia bacterium]|nr:hypothetical protein [Bacteroidia bacterium]